MTTIFISYTILHIFVFSGWTAKYIFKNQLHERSFVLLSIYFLQPILIFWGILLRPINWTLFLVPSLYFLALLIGTVLIIPLRYTTSDKKDAAILQITGLISNTGNLGIPLGLLLFGPASVPYTALINLVNALFIYIVGAYRYSRGQSSIKTSLINVCKLPMIYSALLAIIWQWRNWVLPEFLMTPIEMAAYTAMVLQLMIYGMFIATIQRKSLKLKHITLIQCTKYLLFPLIIFCFTRYVPLPQLAVQCLMLQSLMPIAVNNMNIAALYDCYPHKIALQAVISTLIALIILPVVL